MAEEKYKTSLTGAQVDDALRQLNQRVAEGWAVGSRDGVPQTSGQYYHNNAKYYAENAQASAERAESAVPSGTAGAVFFDRAQSLTDAQKGVARNNIGAGLSNRNLLDNPFFTVNQRGDASYSGSNQFTLDRWWHREGGTGSVVTPFLGTSSPHEVRITAPTATDVLFWQRLPEGLSQSLIGKTITGSVGATGLQSGSNWRVQIHCYDSGGTNLLNTSTNVTNQAISTVTITVPSGTNYIIFRLIGNSGTIRFDRTKLEAGNYSTLANDPVPDYGEELRKCRRYLRVIYPQTGPIYLAGVCQNATQFRSAALEPMQPRSTNASVSLTGTANILYGGASIAVTGTPSVLWPTSADNGVTVIATVASGLSANNPAVMQIAEGSKLVISYEI